MSKLNLDAMGVTEVTAKEAKTIDGGARYFLDGVEVFSKTLIELILRLENYEVEYSDGTPAWLEN